MNQDGECIGLDDEAVVMGRIEVVPEAYIEFTAPRGGITGRVVQAPAPYEFTRFVAFIMSDGADYDFTGNIAPCWRVIFGNGNLDLETTWFPLLDGDDAILGYGTIGKDEDWLRRSGNLPTLGIIRSFDRNSAFDIAHGPADERVFAIDGERGVPVVGLGCDAAVGCEFDMAGAGDGLGGAVGLIVHGPEEEAGAFVAVDVGDGHGQAI